MTNTRRVALLLSLGLVCARADGFAQQSSVSIRGRVVAADNGQPLRRALVTVPRALPSLRTLSDEDGRFEVTAAERIAALTVSKAGYAASTIDITPAMLKSARDIEVRLLKGAVVSGRISRSSGEPVTGARVVARRIDDPDAKDRTRESAVGEALTDDLGEYRISGLRSGRYDVSPQRLLRPAEFSAVARSGRVQPLFRQAQMSAGPARSIEVRAGDERAQIDFQVEASDLPDVAPSLRAMDLLDLVNHTGRLDRAGLLEVRSARAVEPERDGGAVTGTLVDEAGEPLEGVDVQALQVRRETGRMVARDVGRERMTDDRGRFRLFDLPAGKYVVVASMDATPSGLDRDHGNRFTQVFYPGSPTIESAVVVDVDPGRESGGVDFAFAPSRSARVSGVALDPSGEPLVGQVRLIASQRSDAIAPDPVVVRVEWDGTFAIDRVPRGDFVVQAVSTNPGHLDEFGVEFVTVEDRDPPPVTIRTSTGAVLEGRFIVDGGRRAPLRAFSIHAAPTDFDRAPAEGKGPEGLAVFDEGKFSLRGLRGVMRLVPADLPAGWYLKSVTIGGLDVTDAPFDFGSGVQTYGDAQILLSPFGATITAAVTENARTRATSFVAVAFSTTRDLWFAGSRHVKERPSNANGSVDIDGLPPGDYWVVAVDRLEPGDWQTPDVLESLVRGATRVTVTEGQISSLDLRLVRRAR